MKTDVHVRLEYNEAKDGKRDLLSAQLELLRFLKRFKEWRLRRKRELSFRGRMKRELAFLRTSVNHFQGYLPKEAGEIKAMKPKKLREEKFNKSIDTELHEIKEKLARLS